MLKTSSSIRTAIWPGFWTASPSRTDLPGKRASSGWIAALFFSAVFTAAWVWSLPLPRVVRGQNDFLSLYAGATFARTPQLYSAEAAKRLQESVASIWLPSVLYSRPPFYAMLLRPLAWLPYRDAYVLFEVLSLAALAAFLWIWTRHDRLLLILGGISIPVATTLANGQDVFLLLLIVLGAWELERRGKSFAAGTLLPLLAIKFHFFLLIPLILLMQRRWRMLAGAAASAIFLYLVAAFAQGWDWPRAYFEFLRTAEITPAPITMPNLHGLLLATVGEAPRIELALAALVTVGTALLLARIRNLGASLAIAITGGLLISHHAYVQDACLLLLIPILAPALTSARSITLTLLAPPAYFLLVAGGIASAATPLTIILLFVILSWEALREDNRKERQVRGNNAV